MKTKTIIPLAIIAILPFTANAAQTIVTTQTPAAVGANGTVAQAATSGPYQTATIGEHDDEHIATTAYVKGAYNDAIAAVNKVDDELSRVTSYVDNDIRGMIYDMGDTKQDKLYGVTSNTDIDTDVIDGDSFTSAMYDFAFGGTLSDAGVPDNGENHLITADAVAYGMRLFVGGYLGEHPITVYTTWDSDATTPVALSSLGQ